MQNTKAYIMLVCATLFWAGNFMVGKLAYLENIPPMSLVFFRWSLVWIILLPFTYKEVLKNKDIILNNLPLLFFLAFTSVGLFNSFTYLINKMVPFKNQSRINLNQNSSIFNSVNSIISAHNSPNSYNWNLIFKSFIYMYLCFHR